MIKRTLDITFSVFSLVLLSPLFILLTLVVYLEFHTSVFFRQERPGKDGKPFRIYKFRTMTDERSAEGELLPDADRLTNFGRLLRSTSLDELPAMFNVLRGEMSLVGPRPLLMDYLPLYSKEQARRHEIRPGITGWAQVNGRNAISWEQKFELDVWYVDNQSFWLDIRILFLTVLRVFQQVDISQAGEATMHRFTGNSS